MAIPSRNEHERIPILLSKNYDLAVEHLLDLRDLAARSGKEADFSGRVEALREAHARKPSFIERLGQKAI